MKKDEKIVVGVVGVVLTVLTGGLIWLVWPAETDEKKRFEAKKKETFEAKRKEKETFEAKKKEEETFEAKRVGKLDIKTDPTPGYDYQIVQGDNLLTIAGRAYGLGAGGQRLAAAKDINNANVWAWVPGPDDAFHKQHFPNMISFFPKWRPDPTTKAQREKSGDAYAVISIPEGA